MSRMQSTSSSFAESHQPHHTNHSDTNHTHHEKRTTPKESFLAKLFCCVSVHPFDSSDSSWLKSHRRSSPAASSNVEASPSLMMHSSTLQSNLHSDNVEHTQITQATQVTQPMVKPKPVSLETHLKTHSTPSLLSSILSSSAPSISSAPPRPSGALVSSALTPSQVHLTHNHINFQLPTSIYSSDASNACLSIEPAVESSHEGFSPRANHQFTTPSNNSSPVSLSRFEWNLSLHQELSRNKPLPIVKPATVSSLIPMDRTGSHTDLSSLGAAGSIPLPIESPENSFAYQPESSLSQADRESALHAHVQKLRQPFQPNSRSNSLTSVPPYGHQRVHSSEIGFTSSSPNPHSQRSTPKPPPQTMPPDRASVMEPEPVTNLLDHDEIPTDKPTGMLNSLTQSDNQVEVIQARTPLSHSREAMFHVSDDHDRDQPYDLDRLPTSNSFNHSFNHSSSTSLSASSILSSGSNLSLSSHNSIDSRGRLKNNLSTASSLSSASTLSTLSTLAPQHNHHHHTRSVGSMIDQQAPSLVRLQSDPSPKHQSRHPVTAATPDRDELQSQHNHRSIGSIDFKLETCFPPSSPVDDGRNELLSALSHQSPSIRPSSALHTQSSQQSLHSQPSLHSLHSNNTINYTPDQQNSSPSSRRASSQSNSHNSFMHNRDFSPQLKGIESLSILPLQREKSQPNDKRRTLPTTATFSFASVYNQNQSSSNHSPVRVNPALVSANRRNSNQLSLNSANGSPASYLNHVRSHTVSVDEIGPPASNSMTLRQQHHDRLKKAAKRLTS